MKPSAIYSQHHRTWVRGIGRFRRLGPGLVTGAADDDPSGIGTYSQVGAAFGLELIWLALFSLPLAAAVQETAARLGMVTGRGLAALVKERFARPVLYGTVGLVVVANTFNIGADLGSMAESIRLFIPVPYTPLVAALAALILTLEIVVPYHRYARILRWLTLSLVLYIGVLFTAQVDWPHVLHRLLVPAVPHRHDAVAAVIAILGTTISPYLFFWQASEEIEESAEHGGRRFTRRGLSAMRVDVVAGMATAVVIMFAIMVAAAVTLGAHGVTQIQTAHQAAEALRPIAGKWAELMFALGIIGTGLLAVPVLAAASAYALADTFGWHEGLALAPRQAPAFYAVIALSIAVGIGFEFAGINPMRALYFSAILNGVAAPPILLLMWRLSRSLGATHGPASSPLSDAILGATCVIMTVLPIAYLVMPR